MKTRRITFEEVKITAVKRWKDPITGKPRQRTRVFLQTINPFNKDDRGDVKTRYQILAELKAERDTWLKTPEIN